MTAVNALARRLRRRRIEQTEDAAFSWCALRAAGAIDDEAPWPFGDTFGPPPAEAFGSGSTDAGQGG